MEGGTQPPLDLDGAEADAQQPLDLDGMEGDAQQLPACVSKVLDDGNLLTEVIVRVGFPVSLVRAAGVCRRWLSHASDRAFLPRFRELHPPIFLLIINFNSVIPKLVTISWNFEK
uniref:F-box domain-containing protein n=1 Tax=Aegilops tauschii TaxID=37682 RepID=M8BW97_AEGTA